MKRSKMREECSMPKRASAAARRTGLQPRTDWLYPLWVVSPFIYAAIAVISLGVAVAVTLYREEWPSRDARKRADAFRFAPGFADATVGSPAKCEGVLEPVGDPVRGPISGRASVAVCLAMSEDRGESFEEVFSVMDVVPSCVVTDDGQRIPITLTMPDVLRTIHDAPSVDTGPVVGTPPLLTAFCERHGRPLGDERGFTRRRQFQERTITVGTRVCMLGEKTAGASEHAYREAAKGARSEALLVAEHIYTASERTMISVGSFQPSWITFQVMDASDWVAFGCVFIASALALLTTASALFGH
jgi:hypothetical protein